MIADNGRQWWTMWPLMVGGGGRGGRWKTVVASDDRWWQMGWAVATDGGRQ